jgi:hypothetical protein
MELVALVLAVLLAAAEAAYLLTWPKRLGLRAAEAKSAVMNESASKNTRRS